MKITQHAGTDISLTTYTDGWPLRTELKIGNQLTGSLSIVDLHDLHYAVGRQIARIEEATRK